MLRNRKRDQLTVLSIHRISDERNTFWNPIKPASFDKLLDYVKQHYQVINFSQLKNDDISKSKKPLLILSFDDGYHDFYEFALPLLKKHGLTCNHNIVNDCANSGTTIWTQRLNLIFEHCLQNSIPLNIELGNERASLADFDGNWMAFYLSVFKRLLSEPKALRNKLIGALQTQLSIDVTCRMMNWDEIRECAENGVEIGSHTFNHDSLSTITESTVLEHEILTSKTEMEKELGNPINVFALPNGQTGDLADVVISNSDYDFVLYANDELNPLPLPNKSPSPVKISRINLMDEPFPQIALRMEQFHTVMRKYGF